MPGVLEIILGRFTVHVCAVDNEDSQKQNEMVEFEEGYWTQNPHFHIYFVEHERWRQTVIMAIKNILGEAVLNGLFP
jgi:hypothetical protein